MTQILSVPLHALHHNAMNQLLHGQFSPSGRDSWLVDSVRKHGVIFPISAIEGGMIVDGHRRFLAADFLDLDTVPCVMCDVDYEVAYDAAQLARRRSLYSICTLLHDKILELSKTKQKDLSEDDDQVEDMWLDLEVVTGVPRKELIGGVRLLDKFDRFKDSDDVKRRERGLKGISVFREHGFAKAKKFVR